MSRSKEQISSDLKRILVEDLFVDIAAEEIKETDALVNDLGLDSVAHIELFSILEDRYGIKVNTEDPALADQFRTVQSTTDHVWSSLQLIEA